MIQILTKHFPFGNFKAMAVWPFIFLKGAFNEKDVRHEEIHGRQQVEMLIVGFYVAYLVCWVIELVRCARDKERGQVTDPRYKQRTYLHRVEHAIIFEREAYSSQHLPNYLHARRFWAWTKF